jgi:hypothetical protein
LDLEIDQMLDLDQDCDRLDHKLDAWYLRIMTRYSCPRTSTKISTTGIVLTTNRTWTRSLTRKRTRT